MIPHRPGPWQRAELLERRVARGRCWCRRVVGLPACPTSRLSKTLREARHECSLGGSQSPLPSPPHSLARSLVIRPTAMGSALPSDGIGHAREAAACGHWMREEPHWPNMAATRNYVSDGRPGPVGRRTEGSCEMLSCCQDAGNESAGGHSLDGLDAREWVTIAYAAGGATTDDDAGGSGVT